VLSVLYDDGGFSGGTMGRPALKRLIADIEAGQIDVVVVYKVDRLTRALSDSAKLVDVFDRRGVSFVSITQQFNTTTSMGRLTLNVLLSFAQFEREVTGERIRDKIAASKKKGMWMGGTPPLGYDVKNRKLVVNDDEARIVVDIYRRYLALKSVHALRDELADAGVKSKRRMRPDGAEYGGQKFSRGALYLILQNRLYPGEIPHKGNSYPGDHPAIVDKPLWDDVQAVLTANRVERATGGLSIWLQLKSTPACSTKAFTYALSAPCIAFSPSMTKSAKGAGNCGAPSIRSLNFSPKAQIRFGPGTSRS
jgi:DNA invertase Pin-like site-specific DNA recombinase